MLGPLENIILVELLLPLWKFNEITQCKKNNFKQFSM